MTTSLRMKKNSASLLGSLTPKIGSRHARKITQTLTTNCPFNLASFLKISIKKKSKMFSSKVNDQSKVETRGQKWTKTLISSDTWLFLTTSTKLKLSTTFSHSQVLSTFISREYGINSSKKT
jgi:hypothetical protein